MFIPTWPMDATKKSNYYHLSVIIKTKSSNILNLVFFYIEEMFIFHYLKKPVLDMEWK